MYIIKSNGSKQQFLPNKIFNRIKSQSKDLKVDVAKIFQECVSGVVDGMTSKEVDNLIAITAANMIIEDYDYSYFAARIIISRQGKSIGVEPIDSDYLFDFLGITAFLHKYSMRDNEGNPIELPHMMYKRVAEHLFKEKGKKEVDKQYEFLRWHRISLATPQLMNFGTGVRGSGISCFIAGTKVMTKCGWKSIEDVSIGDEVLTHKNRYKKVTKTFKNLLKDRKIHEVKIFGMPTIYCTDNHKFYTKNKYSKDLTGCDSHFSEIKNIRPGDFIHSPNTVNINKKHTDIIVMSEYVDYFIENWNYHKKSYKDLLYFKDGVFHNSGNTVNLLKDITVDKDFAIFVGLFLGDGNIIKNKKLGVQGINITCSTKNDKVIAFIKYYANKIGLVCKEYHSKVRGREWVKLSIHSRQLGLLFIKLFGQYFDGKRLWEDCFNWTEKELLDGLLIGLISSDGMVTGKGEIRFCIANESLTKDIFRLYLNNNYTVSFVKGGRGKLKSDVNSERNGLQQWRLDFKNVEYIKKQLLKVYDDNRLVDTKEVNSKYTHIDEEGQKYSRVMSNKIVDVKSEYVYDIEVEEDHSYCVEGVSVHNCNITTLINDDTQGILQTIDDISLSSRDGAGIGLHIHQLRSKESLVSSFKGNAGGVTRFADMVQAHMRFFKQGNRAGSAALYLGIWHRDIEDFLELRLPTGDEKMRTRDLFTAVCIPDLFMEKLNSGDDEWYVFCPHEVKQAGFKTLHDTWGEEFKELYKSLIEAGLGRKTSVRELWGMITKSLVESGLPYIFYWDNANKQNMQRNISVVRGYNLCLEYGGVSNPNYTSQCNLALVPLHNLELNDFKEVKVRVRQLVKSLNRAIAVNQWSTEAAKNAGLDQRTIGIGIAGLSDYLQKHNIPYISDEAKEFNDKLMETIYKTAIEASSDLVSEYGVYPSWKGSPYEEMGIEVANSLLICLMPSASTSTLLGVTESFEAPHSNIFVRKVDSGEFTVVNKYLIKQLKELGLWNEEVRSNIIANQGSIQNIQGIPEEIKEVFKTIWEIKMKDYIEIAAIRQKNIDQGQSMNLYFSDPTTGKIGGALNHSWKCGLPSGSYYVKTRSALAAPTRLAVDVPQKPVDSKFDCFGCSA